MKIYNDKIPEKLFVAFAPASTNKDAKIITKICDANSADLKNNYKDWAKINNGHYFEEENLKFTKEIKITGIESRSKGKYEWKINIIHNGIALPFDLRKETFLDVIENSIIDHGKIIGCNLIWVKNGSQMRLEMVGSNLYNRLLNPRK